MQTLIKNIGLLAGIQETPKTLLRGAEMAEYHTMANAWLVLDNGRISDYGPMPDYPIPAEMQMVIDAGGGAVFPSFCDSHTHLVYAGSREGEFVDKIRGLSYAEIAKRGGGILNSADRLHNASEEELYEQAIKLISQNNDPNINETELYGELAGVYHAMGDISKSLEIYKAHNAGGIFNTPIGLIMITNGMDLEEADRYLSYGFIDRVGRGINLFLAKALYYYRTGQLDEAKVLFEMVLSENNYMRKNDNPSFLDRLDCVYLTGLAFIELNQKNKNEALRILKEVKSKAEAFDAAPDYDLTNLRFVSRQERLSAYDTLGSTCKEIVENSISELRSPELMKLWKSINKRGNGK